MLPHRKTLEEYERVELTALDFQEADCDVLWRAGALQYEPNPLRWYAWPVAWFAAVVFILAIALFSSKSFGLASSLDDDELGLLSLASMIVAVLPVRALYNRLYKGEWLVDEALAYLRFLLVFPALMAALLLASGLILALLGCTYRSLSWSCVVLSSVSNSCCKSFC